MGLAGAPAPGSSVRSTSLSWLSMILPLPTRWVPALLAGVVACGLLLAPLPARAEVRDATIEALIRERRLEMEGTRKSQDANSTSAGVTVDSTQEQRDRADGFLGFGLGPLFLGGTQAAGETDTHTLYARDHTKTFESHGFGSWLVDGLFTAERDALVFLYSGDFSQSTRNYTNSVSFKTAERTNAWRGGVFYQLFGLGIGVIQGRYEQALQHEELSAAPRSVDEKYRYSSQVLGTSFGIGGKTGFFLRTFVTDERREGARGRQFDLKPGKSVYQYAAVGWAFSPTSVISLSQSLSLDTSELTHFIFNSSRQLKTALNFRIGSFSVGVSEEEETRKSKTQLSGSLEITDSEYRLSRLSLGYYF